MATTLLYDELNELNADRQLQKAERAEQERKKTKVAIPYLDYFRKMPIEQEQIDERIALAEDIEREVLFIFAYWAIRAEVGLSAEQLATELKQRLYEVVEGHTKADSYIVQHIDELADEIIETTLKRDAEILEDDKIGVTSYWLSKDRAVIISENEANSIENYVEYRQAKSKGYTKKRWMTELDEKVRDTHAEIEGKTVDIDGLFLVGTSLMRFPHDLSENPDPEEVINCRCACEYVP